MTREEFLPVINGLAEIYGESLSECKLDIYYDCLKDLSADQLKYASITLLKTRTYQSMPKPSEILEYIGGKLQDRSTIAWEIALGAIKRYGFYNSVSFEDKIINGVIEGLGGWEQFSSMLIEEEPFRRKEFITHYEAYARSGRTCPDRLVGNFERLNGNFDGTKLITCEYMQVRKQIAKVEGVF